MEIKRQIIESATPPSNRNTWWYNPSEGKIMRYTSGSWKDITDKPEKPFKAPITASTPTGIDIYVYDYHESYFLNLENDNTTFNEDLQCNVLNISDTTVLDDSISTNISEILMAKLGYEPEEWHYGIVIVFPESIVEVDSFYSDAIMYTPMAYVFGDKLSQINNVSTLFAEDYSRRMYFQSPTPPIIEDIDEYFGSCQIFVPENALNAYTNATNWGIIMENSAPGTIDDTLTVQEIINELG